VLLLELAAQAGDVDHIGLARGLILVVAERVDQFDERDDIG